MNIVKGKVWKNQKTWYYTVGINDRVFAADNTGNWRVIFDACHAKVFAFEEVIKTGHRIEKTFDQLVDEASFN